MDVDQQKIFKSFEATSTGKRADARYDGDHGAAFQTSNCYLTDNSAIYRRKSIMRGETIDALSQSNIHTQSGDTSLKILENGKGIHGQDSDVDSGIVACGKSGQRIGSTSSTDTDSSQESRQKIEYCSPVQKADPRINGLQLRTTKRASCMVTSNGPIKADHSVLKECNRRPPTPLTVFPDTHHCVRFDEQLQLSEQSLRRSCRKLFATLYGHRFSYPSVESNYPATPAEQNGEPATFRARSQTMPEEELRKRYENLHSSGPYTSGSKPSTVTVDKENLVGNSRKVVSWNLKHPSPKMLEQIKPLDYSLPKQVSVSPAFQRRDLRISGKIQLHSKVDCSSFKTSTDSGLELCRSRCTCQNGARNSGGSSSQSSTSSSSSTNPYKHYQSPSRAEAMCENKNPLVKSNSCSTLPNLLQQVAPPPPHETINKSVVQSPISIKPCPVPLQKTSSCSNLIDRVQLSNVPVYNDNMIHVYAEVASVVPDDTEEKQSVSSIKRNDTRDNYHIYDTVKSPPVSVPPISSSSSITRPSTQNSFGYSTYQTPKRNPSILYTSSARESKEGRSSVSAKDYGQQRPGTPDVYVCMDSRLVPYRNKSYRENSQSSVVATVRPTSIAAVRPQSAVPSSYLKPALKQTFKTTSQQNVSQNSNMTKESTRPVAEVEYAVVDKSKKNRFASLPTLNRFNSNGCIVDEDKDQPPIPPKKNLHKSDIALYRSRSTSPKKTFFEKMHVFTKNARDALQKAFSTERIYRPEREERLEATGQKLMRSKSFIKGLRASISRKRKNKKTPLAEVVPQASSNPVWDELPSGPNSPVHVRGQLLQLNLDGSQVIELSKPPNKPYGFFVARGRVRNSKGVFVSRMRDLETQKQLAGLLDIGDEILEIEGLGVKDADILQVNDLMANKNTILLTVLPYICRKDI